MSMSDYICIRVGMCNLGIYKKDKVPKLHQEQYAFGFSFINSTREQIVRVYHQYVILPYLFK
jgi:hypothetical protein